MINIDVEKVLATEMDRKQFLKTVAVGVVALTGVTAALRAFSQVPGQAQQLQQHGSVDAYGGSAYGGASRSNMTNR